MFVMVFGNLISNRIHLSDLISPFSPYFQLRRYIKRSLLYFIYKHLDISQKYFAQLRVQFKLSSVFFLFGNAVSRVSNISVDACQWHV